MLPFRRSLHHLLPRKPARNASDLPPLSSHARIWSTDTVTEKKSVFQGHAVRVKSVEEAALALQHVLTLKRVSKASHNILAYRISELQTGASDCDGEAPAGKNLLELLQKLEVQDVLLVVTRWYGGSPMGPDRFRVINAVGKSALEAGGFVAQSAKTAKQRR